MLSAQILSIIFSAFVLISVVRIQAIPLNGLERRAVFSRDTPNLPSPAGSVMLKLPHSPKTKGDQISPASAPSIASQLIQDVTEVPQKSGLLKGGTTRREFEDSTASNMDQPA